MAAEREIKTVLTLDDASFSKGLKAATSSVSAARAEMQAAVASAGGLTKGLKKYSAQVTGLNKVLKAEKQQMNVLKKEYDLQKKKLKEAADALKTAKKLHAENSDEVKKAANAYASASSSVDELRVKMAKLNTQVAQDKNGLQSLITGPLKNFGTMAVTAIAAAGAALVKFTTDSDAAQNTLKQNLAASETEFGVWSRFLEQEADKAWKNLGLSKSAYLAAATDIGDFLQQAGAPVQQSAEISAQVLEMAASLSKEYGVPIEEVLSDIKDAANGSRTAMNRYGIQVTGTTVQQTAMTYGVNKTYEAMTEEEQKLWAIQTALDQSKAAQENYKKRTDDVTTASNTLTAAWENFLSGAGSAEDVAVAAENLVASWADAIKTKAGYLAAAASAMATRWLNTFKSTFQHFWENRVWPAIQDFFKAKFGLDLPDWQKLISDIQEGWNTVKAAVKDFFAGNFKIEMPNWTQIKNNISAGWEYLKDQTKDWFKKWFGIELPNWTQIKNNISTGWNYLKDQTKGWFKSVFGIDPPKFSDVLDTLGTWWQGVKTSFTGLFSSPFGIDPPKLSDVFDGLGRWWLDVKDKFVGLFSSAFTITMPKWEDIVNDWNKFWQNAYNNLPQWMRDILDFLGGGGTGSETSGLEQSIETMAELADTASGSLSVLSDAAVQAARSMSSGGAMGMETVPFDMDSKLGIYRPHAGGAWSVPFNNYLARLHSGEMVLTADQARRYRAAAASGGNTYNDSASIYIDKYNQYSGADADALLQQMQAMQRRQRMGYGLA